MKEYLLHFLQYNDWANKTLLAAILQLPGRDEPVAMFSHMIHAQDKWYNRVDPQKSDDNYSWSAGPFHEEQLAAEWERSIGQWLAYMANASEEEIAKDIVFSSPAIGKNKAVSIQDIILQINYHNIHHRAQVNKMISGQGMKVPATDYILTKLKDVNE